MKFVFSTALFALVAATSVAGCSKKSDKKDESGGIVNPIEEVQDKVTEAAASLNLAYPVGLALSAFPQEAASLNLEEQMGEAPPPPKPIAEKVEEAEKVLKGEVDDCVPEVLRTPPQSFGEKEKCYEFDHGMVRTENSADATKGIGTRDGKNSAGEACLVSFGRERISEVTDRVDRATAAIQAMLCQAKKAGKESLPAVGEEVDLKEAMATAFGRHNSNISSAKIARLDDAEGRPVFRSKVVYVDPQGTREVNLVHSPASDEDNTSFNGVLWTKNSQAQGHDHLMSIVYSRSTVDGKPVVKYELKTANVNRDISDQFFDDSGNLDLNASTNAQHQYIQPGGVPYGQANDAVAGIAFIAFEVNPENNAGTLSYWKNPGGNYDEAARGLVFKIDAADDGVLSGCGNSGAVLGESNPMDSTSIRKALLSGVELKPNGYWHPFLQTQGLTLQSSDTDRYWEKSHNNLPMFLGGGSGMFKWFVPVPFGHANFSTYEQFVRENVGGFITSQCFKQNAAGLYEIDTDQSDAVAGYDLIQVSDPKFIQPPRLEGVKPFEVKVKE